MGDVIKLPTVVESMSEIESASDMEYKTIDGFKPDQTLRIGSLTAGDLIEWSEANEGEAKRTAGLRLIAKSLTGPEPENRRYGIDPSDKRVEGNTIRVLRAKSHKVTEKIVEQILDLNGMKVNVPAAKKD